MKLTSCTWAIRTAETAPAHRWYGIRRAPRGVPRWSADCVCAERQRPKDSRDLARKRGNAAGVDHGADEFLGGVDDLNGREFVYTSNANGPFDIWIRNAEDNRARPLLMSAHDSLPEGRLTEIAVAPDGDRFAFTVWNNEHTIWQLRSSGGKAVRVDMDNPEHTARRGRRTGTGSFTRARFRNLNS